MQYMPLLMVILRVNNGKYRRHLIWIVKEMVNDVDGEKVNVVVCILSEKDYMNKRYMLCRYSKSDELIVCGYC